MQRFLSSLAALLVTAASLLAACAPGAGEGGDDDDDSSGAVLGDTVEHYFGDSTASGITDDWALTTSYLVRRSLFPTESRITEELYNTGDGSAFLVEMEVDVAASTFTLAFADGSYTGSGTLTGSAWAWTGWASTSTALDGSTVESTDTLTAQQLVVTKIGRDASGAPEWSAGEVFSVIEEAEWQERFAELPDSSSQ